MDYLMFNEVTIIIQINICVCIYCNIWKDSFTSGKESRTGQLGPRH